MKILLISNMYPNNFNPQYGIFVKNTAEILIKNRVSVKKIVMNKKNNKLNRVFGYILFYSKSLINLLINDYDYIYVHYVSHSSLPVIIAKFLRPSLKIISNVHGSDIIPENKTQKYFANFTKRMLIISDTIISPSNYYMNLLNNRFKIDYRKIKVFPSGGIDNNIFYPSNDLYTMKKKIYLDTEFKYIGFVGRLDYGKGWDIFLESINHMIKRDFIKYYKFIIVGNGKEEKKFKEKVIELGLQNYIIHLNFLDHDRLRYLYNSLEAFCFPTVREGESLGLVGLEALSCGVPVIASNFAGPTDYVRDSYNGYLFKKNDSFDLSKKIEKFILLREEKKEELKRNAYESSKKYWRKNIEDSLIKIFKN